MPILMVNEVAYTKSDIGAKWKSHVKVHLHSVNVGQSGNIDQGEIEEQNPRAQMRNVGRSNIVAREISRKYLSVCIFV